MNINKELSFDQIRQMKQEWRSTHGLLCYECKNAHKITNLYIIYSSGSTFKYYLVFYCDVCVTSRETASYVDQKRLLSEKERFVYNIL